MPDSTSTIAIEDASALTKAAWDALLEHKKDAGLSDLAIGRLDQFLQDAERKPLSPEDKKKIIDQASLIFNNLYSHLPFKLDQFQFAHPVEWLDKNVRPFLETMSEADFHGFVIAAFSLVRDAHTLYGLPTPFRGAVAFLPFQLRYYLKNNRRRYVVSKVMQGFEHPEFEPGVEITEWAGFPVENFLQAIAGRLSGGNTDAVFSRGAYHMTLRPLTFCQPPGDDELKKTVIQYIVPGKKEKRQIQFPWGVVTGIDQGHGFPSSVFSLNSTHLHADHWDNAMHRGRSASETEKPATALSPAEVALSLPSKVAEAFDVQFTGGPDKPGVVDPAVLTTDPPSDARVGYIRIKRFSDGSAVGGTQTLVNEFRRLLTLMDEVTPDGLIIDLRSCPGGDVLAAEQMLQMLTPTAVAPANFHLANTAAMLEVLQRVADLRDNRGTLSAEDDTKLTDALVALEPWLADAKNVPLPEGERLTSGQPLTDVKDANSIGQVYHGRTVLLIDALTYSAAEIFAAGFQDHAIGPVIGMDRNTGGGGANVWTHTDLLQRLGPMSGLALEPLPLDATMSVAIRRNSRVGFCDGHWVEDIGVIADIAYIPDSVDDVLFDYPGVVHMACNTIMAVAQFRADVVKFAVQREGSVKVELRSINIDAIDAYLDGHKVVEKGKVTRLEKQEPSLQEFTLPAAEGNANPASLKIAALTLAPGEHGDELMLAAVHHVQLQAPAPVVEEEAPPQNPDDSTADSQ